MVWDLTRLEFVRQLATGPGGLVCAVAVSGATGDMVTCSRDAVHLWDLNGTPLATTPLGCRVLNSAITCCALQELAEWSDDPLVVTGHQDGRVQLWQVDFVSVRGPDGAVSWRRVLQPCCLLASQMHGGDPAPVTLVRWAPDNRRLFVGDARGRAFQWTHPDVAGRATEHWVKDTSATACMGPGCGVRFSFSERRHHCRHCGKVFCGKCSNRATVVPSLATTKSVRVCNVCFETLGGGSGGSDA